ncbi:UDP-N-acetylglucosamine 4,6-dehydratase [Crocinitomicaceae bacterium]|nr:UDP-N-acetylglucosamine 4,6-dehydratase [Crocinitomicaceae bacterium]MDC1361870.1 UDP-N-acetylglucosamine 4,6-dehydratase [Crocinitomicaceae bacterium]
MNILELIGRSTPLFKHDIEQFDSELNNKISTSSFLILGGAGSIGQSVVKEIFKRNPRIIHIVDLNENNLTELVRDLRSSMGYISGEFKTFALDIGSEIFDVFMSDSQGYDYVLNFTAIKHVRSEKDPYTLSRMIETNIFNTDKTITQAIENNCKKYFCVSTDKAANPVNLMGGTKRIMEKVLMNRSQEISLSTARFANVAFSDGSLLHGFNQRILKKQPIVAPKDVRRYFVTPEESGQLCMLAAIFGENRDIYFPKLSEHLHLMTFSDIAIAFLKNLNYTPYICMTEDEARSKINELINKKQWPCLFFESDTTGEKGFEEFYTKDEEIEMNKFDGIGIIKNKKSNIDRIDLKRLREKYSTWIKNGDLSKEEIATELMHYLPELEYKDIGKYLDDKM